MMAAIAAAEAGERVLLLEKNEKLGKKLYITGKGRGNFTNTASMDDFMEAVVSNPKFLYSALYGFSNEQVLAFFAENGCPYKIERGGRAFPASDHASDLTRALEKRMHACGVQIWLHTRLSRILLEDGRVCGVECKSKGQVNQVPAKRLILATGGLSYPSTGSSGDGHRIAEGIGHTIQTCRPALAPLVTKESYIPKLQGLSLKNVSLTIDPPEMQGAKPAATTGQPTGPATQPAANPAQATGTTTQPAARKHKKKSGSARRKPLYYGFGEMLFTHFGISGPIVLSASSKIGRFLDTPAAAGSSTNPTSSELCELPARIDLKPAISFEELDSRIMRTIQENPAKAAKNLFSHLLPGKLIPVFCSLLETQAGIAMDKKLSMLTKEERDAITQLLKGFPLTIVGIRGFEEAIVTSGGISVKEVNPHTMESKIISGLYFSGELLDVDALTGGYNLQIAFSTGYLAGSSGVLEK